MGFTHFCPPGLIDIASWVLQNLPYEIYAFLPSKPCCFIGLTKSTLDITCYFQDLVSALLINIYIYARITQVLLILPSGLIVIAQEYEWYEGDQSLTLHIS